MEAWETNSYEDLTFEVEFMSCVVDKAKDLKVTESDSHFSEFTGVHPSKINQGKLDFLDLIISKDRELVLKQLCKKNSPYVYLDFYIKNKSGEYIYIHCLGQNIPNSTLCRLALADVSQSAKKTEELKVKNESFTSLVDMVEGAVCVFKVNSDMQLLMLYMNLACSRFFSTANGAYLNREYKLDELVYKEDKSSFYQAIGKALATKKPIDLEVRLLSGEGKFVWCKLNSAIQRIDEDGLPVFHAVITDISKIKAAEQQADSELSNLVDIFKNLPGPQFCAGVEEPFKLDIVSKDFMKLIGYTRTEFFETLGGDLRKLIAPEDSVSAEKEIKNKSLKRNTVEVEYTLVSKSGERITVRDTRRIVKGRKGEKSALGILKRI